MRRLDRGLVGLWAVASALLAARLAGHAADDFFITYRYAWNLAHGAGFAFNPGERVFGTTDAGFGLLLAAVHFVTRIPVPVVGTLVFGAGLVTAATLLLREAGERGQRAEIALGGSLVVGSSYLWANHGAAETLVLALLAGAALLAGRRPVAAGLLAGAAVWCRPDAALGVAVLGLLMWREERRPPLRFGLAAAGVVLAGVALAAVYFGVPLPATLEGKRIMAEARGPEAWAGLERFWGRGASLLGRHWGAGWLLAVGLGLAGMWPLLARGGRALRTVVLYGLAVGVAYPILGVPFFPWYIVPTVAALLLGLAGLAVGLGRELGGGPARRGLVTATVLAVPLLSIVPAAFDWFTTFRGFARYEAYGVAARWIGANARPGDRLAFGEVGVLAYESRLPVDDLMGLVTPRSLPFVAAGDPVGAFLARPPEWFLAHPRGPGGEIRAEAWFSEAYELATRIGSGEDAVTVYRRREGTPMPPPRPPLEKE